VFELKLFDGAACMALTLDEMTGWVARAVKFAGKKRKRQRQND
jgi:hypothetical protein